MCFCDGRPANLFPFKKNSFLSILDLSSCSIIWKEELSFFVTITSLPVLFECLVGIWSSHTWWQWRIYIVKFWTPPRGSKFFQFHAVFGKFDQNRMLAPHLWEILDPPLGGFNVVVLTEPFVFVLAFKNN